MFLFDFYDVLNNIQCIIFDIVFFSVELKSQFLHKKLVDIVKYYYLTLN